ncbi:hypothetical protein WJR50_32100 [Catalinimonas sp. 4WD22]
MKIKIILEASIGLMNLISCATTPSFVVLQRNPPQRGIMIKTMQNNRYQE